MKPSSSALRPSSESKKAIIMKSICTGGAVLSLAFAALCAIPVRGEEKAPAFKLETIRGHAVFLGEALERKFAVKTVPEARQRTIAIETADGQLVPVVEDVRGRAFRADERLRKPEIEVLVRRYEGSPSVQVIRLFELAADGKYELDYWCDICAITMFELKECECCQGDIELRRTKK